MAAAFIQGLAFQPENRIGFDGSVSPPWVMVPVNGSKNVQLQDGAGLTLAIAGPPRPGVVAFSETGTTIMGHRGVRLQAGATPGTVILEARDAGGKAQASLEVTVKSQVGLATFIHFVFDQGHRASRRGLDEALQVMGVANKILLPQANVMMFRRDSGGVYLPVDLPQGVPLVPRAFNVPASWAYPTPGPMPCYSNRPPGPLGCLPPNSRAGLSADDFLSATQYDIVSNIISHVDRQSDYNIFFVKNLDQGPPPHVGLTMAYTPSVHNLEINACILPDMTGGQTLAHELCHFLLRGSTFMDRTGHSSGPHDLMQIDPGDAIGIPKQQANFINPSGVAGAPP